MKWLLSFIFTIFYLIFFTLIAFYKPTQFKFMLIIMVLGMILGVVMILRKKK